MDNTAISILALLLVFAVLFFFAAWGFHQGFLRHILTTMAFVVTIVLSGLLAPTFSHLIQDSAIGKSIESGIHEYVMKNMGSEIIETSKDIQDQIIEKLPLPSAIQNDLAAKNTEEGYLEVKAKGFADYMSARLSGMAINIVTYLLLMIVVYLIIRIVMRLLKLINRIPLIGGVNRLLGGLVGLAEGLILIWVICLIIMALSGTEFGRTALSVIQENDILKFIYENNGIVLGANALFHSFL